MAEATRQQDTQSGRLRVAPGIPRVKARHVQPGAHAVDSCATGQLLDGCAGLRVRQVSSSLRLQSLGTTIENLSGDALHRNISRDGPDGAVQLITDLAKVSALRVMSPEKLP